MALYTTEKEFELSKKAEEVPYQTEALVFKTSLQRPHYRRSDVTSIRGICLLNLLMISPITAAEFRRKRDEQKWRLQIRPGNSFGFP
ncbi:hypothetical protein CEXT_357921 [Caerostris extrusa]|uniref:Uncharacterized protein n=1 Tax=Caerostris extrusa TaxID=172846 RepID=A0AAV4XWW7_CAEEX|nr:hypothetical protein CEXT_357921 [Caerostris extrusa]